MATYKAKNARNLLSLDTRASAIEPQLLDANNTALQLDFKQKSITGLTADYSGILSYRPYASGGDWTGGPAHQIAFDTNGLHWHKSTNSTTWGSWRQLVTIADNTAAGGITNPIYINASGEAVAITAGTTGQFYRGDKTWSNVLTGNLTLGSILTLNASTGEHRVDFNLGNTLLAQFGTTSDGASVRLWTHNGTEWKAPLIVTRATSAITLTGDTTINGSSYISGTIASKDYYQVDNLGEYVNRRDSVTGMVVITLPQVGAKYDMLDIKIYVYEYNSNGASEILIGGHNWNNAWYNTSYSVEGNYSKSVRLAYDGTNYCIVLGEINSTWNYPQIYLKHIFTGYGSTNAAAYSSRASFALKTSESGYTFYNPPRSMKRVRTSLNIEESSNSEEVVNFLQGGYHKNQLCASNSAFIIYSNKNWANNATSWVQSISIARDTSDVTLSSKLVVKGGNITSQKAGDTWVRSYNTQTGTSIYLDNDVSGHGLWSENYWTGSETKSSSKWMIYRSTDGKIYVQGHAEAATKLYASDSPYRYQDSGSYYAYITYNNNGDSRWYMRVYPETPKTLAVDWAYGASQATKISSTPNNTTTFLRGDNTWSNVLTGSLTLKDVVLLNGASGEHRIDYMHGSTWLGQIGFNANNFYLWVHDGSQWKTPIIVARSTSAITLTGNTTLTGTLSVSSTATVADRIYARHMIIGRDGYFVNNVAVGIWQGSPTGEIVIKLPYKVTQYDMPIIKIYVYEYSAQGASEIIIGGHNWPSGSTYAWYNSSFSVEGNFDKSVRLGHDGTYYCIFLGATNTTWSYVGIYVEHCFTQYSTYLDQWKTTACTVTKITSESGYTINTTPTRSSKTARGFIARAAQNNMAFQVGPTDWANTGIQNGNGDGNGQGTANLVLRSWYGVGFMNGCTNAGTNGAITAGVDCRVGYIYSNRTYGAVWNDYAECRQVETNEPGYCVTETFDGHMIKTNQRLQPGCRITSDTYGMCIGETKTAKTPIAVSGRVLVYPYRNKFEYPLGAAVCSAPNGTVDIMTRDEIMMYPERIIGTVSEIPTYEIWHCGGKGTETTVEVKGRIWIYVK